ncbi:PH domain-containing protein [Arthrobacter sp. UM1]|uniref:PH domain-containing protein n=1 Tax=Arthrobacter sp. UM1 TaxID=2766776 RepID=UPI001CF62B03|nr:PH domain-containing protein [Arthrobacter sp. UM1]MCB4207417.1 PH domain-containing protein [Arthrobacter sp. UM1]
MTQQHDDWSPTQTWTAHRAWHRTSRVVLAAGALALAVAMLFTGPGSGFNAAMIPFSVIALLCGAFLAGFAVPTVRVQAAPAGLVLRGRVFQEEHVPWEDITGVRTRSDAPVPRVPAFLYAFVRESRPPETVLDIGGPAVMVATDERVYTVSCPDPDAVAGVVRGRLPSVPMSADDRATTDARRRGVAASYLVGTACAEAPPRESPLGASELERGEGADAFEASTPTRLWGLPLYGLEWGLVACGAVLVLLMLLGVGPKAVLIPVFAVVLGVYAVVRVFATRISVITLSPRGIRLVSRGGQDQDGSRMSRVRAFRWAEVESMRAVPVAELPSDLTRLGWLRASNGSYLGGPAVEVVSAGRAHYASADDPSAVVAAAERMRKGRGSGERSGETA